MAIREGARGYLRKDVTLAELVAAIQTLAAGGTHLQPALTASLLEGARALPHPPEPPLVEPLTPRETEVLRLMAAACTNREIAEALGTAEGTVKIHVSNILSKLGARDRTQAVLQFLDSQEFRTDVITALYTELLGRTPEKDGLKFWLNRNFELEDIREGIMESHEFRGRFGSED